MENIQFNIPDGYVIDESASTKTIRIYKKIEQKITDRVKTFADACSVLGINQDIFSVSDTKDERAYKMLKVIIKALNEGWKPNWEDNQAKWYPYFKYGCSGFGFSGSDYYYDCARTVIGSRLCFKSEKLTKYEGLQFIEIYKDYLT